MFSYPWAAAAELSQKAEFIFRLYQKGLSIFRVLFYFSSRNNFFGGKKWRIIIFSAKKGENAPQAIKIYQQVYDLDPKEEAGVFNLAVCLVNSMEEKHSERFGKVCQERAKQAE